MTRFVLLKLTGPVGCDCDVLPRDGATVVRLAEGRAVEALLAAAKECKAIELHHVKLTELPRVHREVGDREYQAAMKAMATTGVVATE